MAGYDGNKLSSIVSTIENQGPNLWSYITADSLATVMGAGYMSDAQSRGMRIGDLVLVAIGTLNTAVYGSPSTADVGEGADFTAVPTYVWLQCVSFTTGAANLAGQQQTIGGAATDKVGFYGATPVVQRASSVQATSLISAYTATTASALIGALLVEIANTLNGLGIWKGSA